MNGVVRFRLHWPNPRIGYQNHRINENELFFFFHRF
jgi:hypothetical protein